MKIIRHYWKDNSSVVFADEVNINGMLANNLYIYIDSYNKPILGSGTFVAGSESEKQLIELIQHRL